MLIVILRVAKRSRRIHKTGRDKSRPYAPAPHPSLPPLAGEGAFFSAHSAPPREMMFF